VEHERVERWAGVLESAARASLERPENRALVEGPPEKFRDERGGRRAVDDCLLARTGRSRLSVAGREPRSADEAWWLALVGAASAEVVVAYLNDDPTGPLTRQPARTGVEVWTETELSALHAAAGLAAEGRAPEGAGLARCAAAARWNIEHMQPDNATNHPWAVHVFAWLSVVEGNADAELYAQTLVHNSMVTLGRADVVSGLILRDAGRGIVELARG
jgi:hypothetical protein